MDTQDKMMLFIINQTTAPTRREKRGGRECLVVPVVGVKQGVLKKELVLAKEFGRGYEAWNGRPVTITHPAQGGQNVSANTPEMLERFQVGQLFNTRMNGDKLVPEMWIDLEKAKLVDGGPEVVERFERGEMTEVSTAYLRDLDETPGTYNGTPYIGIARNIKPDHLAILLSEEGACSIEDGCGAPRINKQEETMKTEQTSTPDADKSEKTQNWLVRQVKKLARKSSTNLEVNMAVSKEELVRHLLNAEGHTFNEEDLTPLSQSALEKLAVLLASNAPPDEETEDDGEPEPKIPGVEPELEDEMEVQSNQDEKQTDAQPCANTRLDAIEAQFAEIAAHFEASFEAERVPLVEAIVANSGMTTEQIGGFDLATLKSLQASIVPADYSGQGGGPQAATGTQGYFN